MTPEFLENCTKGGSLFDAIFTLMTLGKTPEISEPYNANKPLLSQIDNFINYYLAHNDGEHCQVPLFISYSTNPKFRNIFIEYLVIRLGVFNPHSIASFNEEEQLNLRRGLAMGSNKPVYVEPEKDDSAFSKKYYKRINFLSKFSDKSGKLTYGVASRLFRKKALSLTDGIDLDGTVSQNMIVCRKQELPDSRDTLLKDFYSESVSSKSDVFCNTQLSGTTFYDALDECNIEFDIDNPTRANIFLLYSNTEQAYFLQSDIELLEQVGYKVENQFIFVLHSRPFCMSNLRRDLIKFQAKYTKEIFFLNSEETAFLCNLPPPKLNQLFIGDEEDYNIYGLEVQNILDGVFYPYNIRNILSLCATANCEDLFFDFLQNENPDYDLPESTEVFDYIRLQWEDNIVPAVESFAKSNSIAFVVDWKTPNPIRDEVASLFPNKRVSFYTLQDLKPTKDYPNSIIENYIIVLRYTGFKEYDITFPNSYEPVYLKEGQNLLEIVPFSLFAANVARTENNLVKYFNSVMQNGYRRDCLGWKRKDTKSLIQYAVERDEDDDYKTPERDTPKVVIKYESGRMSPQIESTPVIFKKGSSVAAGRLSDIVDDSEVSEIQLIDEIENHLGVLVNESEHKDSDLERAQRRNYEQSYGIVSNPDIEIWRLLLLKNVELKGKEIVYQDLISRIEKYEKKPKEIIDRWLDFRITNLILPKRKRTKNIVFEYLGIPITSPYRGIVYRKKMRAIQSSMEKNRLLDQIIFAVINGQVSEGSYRSIYSQIPDALDLLDVTNDADLEVIKQEILNNVSLSKINSITVYGE